MSDYILNKAGAKIFKDLKKHNFIEVPVLRNQEDQGAVHNVLSVGFLGLQREPIATVKEPNGTITAYRLPHELIGFVESLMETKLQGIDMFPSKVEFGKLNDRIYAEIL
jgi:hypothetical protein